GTGTPYSANSSFAWYSNRSTCVRPQSGWITGRSLSGLTPRARARPVRPPAFIPRPAAHREARPSSFVEPVVSITRDDGSTEMPSPVVHFEIRSSDPDATRKFFGQLFGWTFPDGGIPGYTYVDTGVEGAVPGAISPLQGGAPLV